MILFVTHKLQLLFNCINRQKIQSCLEDFFNKLRNINKFNVIYLYLTDSDSSDGSDSESGSNSIDSDDEQLTRDSETSVTSLSTGDKRSADISGTGSDSVYSLFSSFIFFFFHMS